MAQQFLDANAIHKTVTYKGVTKTITDTYWTSDIVPAIYPLWDSDKDKLVLFAWYDNDTYLAQKRKYTKNFKDGTWAWKDYEMEDLGGTEGQTLFDKFKDAFFLADSLDTLEYEAEFAKIHAKTSTVSWLTVRLSRNFLLSETDWSQLPDAPIDADTKAQYTLYRQKLRDLPSSGATDAASVKFPINPKYFKDIWLPNNPSATYLGDDTQWVAMSSTYFTTFKEKFASYLIVSSITEGVYNKGFMDALAKSGKIVADSTADQTFEFTDAERTNAEAYLNNILKKIEEEKS